MKDKFFITILLSISGLIGLFSSIYIINYDYIYAFQEILSFSKKTIYLDYFPFVGIGNPLFLGSISTIFTNKIYFIFVVSFIVNSLFTHIFYKITYFITNNKIYSFCAGISGALWFATNFGLVFYQDYMSYYFFLLAVYFSFKRKEIVYVFLTSLLLVTSFHFKNSIGLIIISVFFLVDFLIINEELKIKTKIKTFIYFNITFIISLLLIYLFFDFKNYFEYTFKILLTEGTSRIKDYNEYDSNNIFFLYIYEILYNLIVPYKINLVEAFLEKSIGRILFIPFILIFYFLVFISLYYLIKIIKRLFIGNHVKTFYFIFTSSFLISVVAGRDFTQLTLGIPIVTFTTLFFLLNNKNIIFIYFLTFLFISTNFLYKYYHSSFYKNIYNNPITTKEIEPLYFYNLKAQINTQQLLNAYNFINLNNIKEVLYLGHNAKIISFLNGEQGLEFDSYFHYNMSKHQDRFTYDCKIKGLSNCELYLINHVNDLDTRYILLSDNFYRDVMSNFNLLIKENYIEIYKDEQISLFEKK